ncbi:hypothetical protein PHYSODRAFT_249766 [Phytophthora sojae]|uniref:Uncharacterized protein n=1 Tax=Phytophthora sojae (strain P6497) TaxID=1094619 RepID=G4ZQ02_PHYSP|nr:hypothetical protein PHYSODRAFT_249766 [Phytophthora sojae]EGZ16406.1 hypothetical protein PHYSODRAFT_249766 [Phytophthora sojae]|eukprot:XP_009530155.1 hypothetical protein PHYSODRAFT_249766 [Phytophthora sojae]
MWCACTQAAHDTDIRPICFYCRGVVWLAILTAAEQIYTTVQISESDGAGAGPTKDDIVSANIFQTIMLVVMWLIAIRHSYLHQCEVSIYNQSFAAAAMNAAPPVHLPEVVQLDLVRVLFSSRSSVLLECIVDRRASSGTTMTAIKSRGEDRTPSS